MKKNLVLAVIVLVISLGSVASCDEGKKNAQPYDIKKQSIEMPAPDFELRDLDGKAHSLRDYRGKTVLLLFTTTWCPYCIKDIPNMKKLHETYKDAGLEIIAVYIQESETKVGSFVKKYELPYTIFLDAHGSVAQTYGIRGVPTKVLVDRNGTILCWACRSLEVMLEEQMGGVSSKPVQ